MKSALLFGLVFAQGGDNSDATTAAPEASSDAPASSDMPASSDDHASSNGGNMGPCCCDAGNYNCMSNCCGSADFMCCGDYDDTCDNMIECCAPCAQQCSNPVQCAPVMSCQNTCNQMCPSNDQQCQQNCNNNCSSVGMGHCYAWVKANKSKLFI